MFVKYATPKTTRVFGRSTAPHLLRTAVDQVCVEAYEGDIYLEYCSLTSNLLSLGTLGVDGELIPADKITSMTPNFTEVNYELIGPYLSLSLEVTSVICVHDSKETLVEQIAKWYSYSWASCIPSFRKLASVLSNYYPNLGIVKLNHILEQAKGSLSSTNSKARDGKTLPKSECYDFHISVVAKPNGITTLYEQAEGESYEAYTSRRNLVKDDLVFDIILRDDPVVGRHFVDSNFYKH